MAKNRRLISLVTAAAATLALALTAAPHAAADPDNNNPGQPPAGKTPAQIYAGVGADAFAELTNNLASTYNATNPTVVLASYDAVNPLTGVPAETITTKTGCSIIRPNGANAGITAILSAQQYVNNDSTQPYCIDFVRSSRGRGTAAGEANLTFYAQSRDAVSYATIGNAYAPTTPLTTTQLKNIFTCKVTDWSQVGGQAGEIHLYLPPSTAATYTFFLSAIGATGGVGDVQAGCGLVGSNPDLFNAQQNDGRTLLGDPQGITPYAVTKWAAQTNNAPSIGDYRGGADIGLINGTTVPFTTGTVPGDPKTYLVLNPAFVDPAGASASFGRYFFNVVRKPAAVPTQEDTDLKNIFGVGGYLCSHQAQLLVPFGNGLLTADPQETCGQAN